jgi:hypothetical protein
VVTAETKKVLQEHFCELNLKTASELFQNENPGFQNSVI